MEQVAKNYESMSDLKLLELVKNPKELRLEVLPLLQKELINRGKSDEALSISNYLIQTKIEPNFGTYSKQELTEIISERIDRGESIESIKIDLKDNGIDMFELLSVDDKLKNSSIAS